MKRFALALAMVVAMYGGWLAPLRGAVPACDADNGGITLPAGFCAAVVTGSTPVPGARHIVIAPNGDMIVSFNGFGRGQVGGIMMLRDTNGDGKADAAGER